MITLVLHCPNCDGVDIVRHGKSPEGKQRYRCREQPCNGRTVLRHSSSAAQLYTSKVWHRCLSHL